MQTLVNKRIVVGITGGIAAYKSAELVRELMRAGAEVRVVMTDAAKEFITPLTLQALSGKPVHHSLLDEEAEMGMGHIELARWADLLLVAPATADFIARMAAGMGNDLLTTLCLATRAPIALAPAMNEKMWLNATTQANVQRLRDTYPDLRWFGPDAGQQACGDVGPGRMLEPEGLVELAAGCFAPGLLTGRRVVITAGPTREAIDPVRYLSNHSSGKMGFALARAAAEAGAEVVLIAGPVDLATPERVTRIDVVSAQQMYEAALARSPGADLFIATAAVADFRPAEDAAHKIKKQPGQSEMTLKLVQNPDIVAGVAGSDKRPACVVAFAAETQNVEDYARRKLSKKGVDWVVANDVSRTDIGFGSDSNEILLVGRDHSEPFGPAGKQQVARFLVEAFARSLGT
ncbi:bifunctional phosphopantothenoylcysteine decarboxylase/phosphopantothenate--cysteine ligase CoaBC [Saccharospirillum salsuginis]|uniref:Coenzyme A biosynthesis bifunctional protein CoaBC n=1 Tax=Saccharospirillum salsuginis TaxID=418750 RepID=A0A918N8A9_9GAMM|nr:bifunctional phosphopantothenoylcysteine decarboxylase/phosphopantothenate--cysteine ligase CoaBC [Saccharospirillum salsuginis]GGX47535.1 phosphopantothenoylcysteine decarboxylase [Saccharospirillum salsuginis]